MNYISRQDALRRDLSHYFTGKPCKHGHVANRTTTTRKCVECSRRAATEFHHKNRDVVLEKRRKRYADDPHAAQKARLAYAANPEIAKRSERKRRNKYPEMFKQKAAEYYRSNSESIKAKVRDYNQKYSTTISERRRKSYAETPTNIRVERSEKRRGRWDADPSLKEQAYAKAKSYREENVDLVRAHKSNRAAMLKAARGNISAVTVSRLREYQKDRCLYCDADCSTSFHVDHIIPLAKGGTNELTNLAIACPPCNLRKQARHPLVFLAILWKELQWI